MRFASLHPLRSVALGAASLTGLLALTAATTPVALAQATATSPASQAATAVPAANLLGTDALPDAPAAASDSSSAAVGSPAELASALPELPVPQVGNPAPAGHTTSGAPVAPITDKYIPAGWQAQRLSAKGKIEVGATDLYSVDDLGAVVLSAAYEQVLNSEPNYGSNGIAFAQRVGAAAAREVSQGVFTDMIMANLTHEDPRYYQLGDNYGLVHRTLYSITRPLITRTDSGHRTINAALLIGYAGSAALTPTYYPQVNRNFHDVASVYGGSIGGAALGFFVSEFSSDVLRALHLSHAQ